MTETPKQAAHRLAAAAIAGGFQPEALHTYNHTDGKALYWRIRCKRADGAKWVRPMHLNGHGYELGEPKFPIGKPLYGLDRLTADPVAAVFVVEGESCADALHKLGVVATTSGSCSSADAADWTPLRGRACVMWPDNDGPGASYAAAVVTKLHALQCGVRLVSRDAVERLPDGGDVVDWLAQHANATAADIAALPTVEAEAPSDEVEPEPLRRPLPPAAEYPLDALGDVLGDAARVIHDVVKAPAAMCGVSVLAAASLAAQHLANMKHDSFEEPLSLWAVTIGESGERKSAVDKWALGAHYQHEQAARANYDAALRDYNAELSAYTAAVQKAKAGKGKTRDSIRAALRDVGPGPEPPLVPLLVLGEPTLEGAQKQLINGWPSLGLFSSDAGEFLGGYSMSAEQKTRTAASLSKLWDNGIFDRVRAKADETSGKFSGKRVALHLMVQPVIAESVLSDEVLAGQGFLPRCLLAWPASTIGGRDYVARDLHDAPELRRYWAKVHALLDRPFPLAEGRRNELAPRALTLAPDAAAMWVQTQNAIEHAMADSGQFASIRAWASKAGAQVLRVAGVLALFENPDAATIDKRTVERAAELLLWHLGEAVRIVGTASVPREIRDAEALRDWCHKEGIERLHSRAAIRLGPPGTRTADRFNAAVDVLVRTGWAIPIEAGTVVDGKARRRVWRIVGGEI